MMDEALIDIRNVTYRINNSKVLDNVALTVAYGENVIVFGPESSGTNGLFDLIVMTGSDFEGEILFKGHSVKEFDYIKQFDYKKEVGYVHGDYGLISNMTVEQNISLPLEYHSSLSMHEIKKLVDKTIYDLNLDHCKKLRPIDLTRSEILKTAFGRAIILDPDLLYIENAFEDQCPLNIKTVTGLLYERSLRPDRSLIIITHYPQNYLDLADSYVMFFGGRIVFRGKKEEFLNSDNPYLVQYRNNSSEGPMVIL